MKTPHPHLTSVAPFPGLMPCAGPLTAKALFQVALLVAGPLLASASLAQDPGAARPQQILREIVANMPKGEKQEVRVLTATLKPGDKTPFHTHRFPVTVYILDGSFTLELDGRDPVIMKAGQSYVEPPNVKMTGYNRSSDTPARLVIFYVSEPDTPFLDPVAN